MNAHTISTSAPVGARRHVDLNTIQTELEHLVHLMDATVDCIQELDFPRDEHGHCPMDRMAALAWVARDMAERIAKQVDDNFFEIQGGRN